MLFTPGDGNPSCRREGVEDEKKEGKELYGTLLIANRTFSSPQLEGLICQSPARGGVNPLRGTANPENVQAQRTHC
jgi:hypothetical protein